MMWGISFEVRARFNTPYVGYNDTVMQYEITSKVIHDNLITYQIEGIGRAVSIYNYICCDTLDVSFFDINKTLTYQDDPDHLLNHVYTRFPMTTIEGYGPEPRPVIIQPQWFLGGGLTGEGRVSWQKTYLVLNDSSDIIEELETEVSYVDREQAGAIYLASIYDPGVGLVYRGSEWSEYEYLHSFFIAGMKKDGQLYGEFTPNGLALPTGDPVDPNPNPNPPPDREPSSQSDCEAYSIIHQPDQASDRQLQVELIFSDDAEREFELIRLDGRRIMQQSLTQKYHQISLPPNLATGMYMIKVGLVGGCVAMKKTLIW